MATDSIIGFASATLTNPAPSVTYADSPIGFASAVLANPSAGYRDSLIGFASQSFSTPHLPVGVMVGGVIRYGAILTKQGNTLR
jgi:hypothetical protein